MKRIICKLLDQNKKGYVTIGNIGTAGMLVTTAIAVAYSLYHSAPMLKACIYDLNSYPLDFCVSNLDVVCTGISMLFIGCSLVVIMTLIANWSVESDFVVCRCDKEKEKKEK